MKKSFIKWGVAGWMILITSLLLVGCQPRTLFSGASGINSTPSTVRLSRGPLTVTISAVGSARSSQSAVVSWQASGKVGEVLAKVGQQVSAGDVLARLDPASLPQNILQAQVDLINAQKALDDLKEVTPLELAQADSNVKQAQKALDDLLHPSETVISQAELAVINAQTAVDDAQKSANQVKHGRGSDQQIASARADLLLAEDDVATWQAVYDRTLGDPERDLPKANALTNLVTAQNKRDHALRMLNWYLGKPTELQVNEADTELALAQARLADAQKSLEDLKTPSEVDIALARAKLADAQDNLAKLKNGPNQDDLTIAETRLTQAQAALKQGYLEAPFSGTVNDVQALPGDLVSPGTVAFRLDNLSGLFVDLQVSEVDVHQVQVGQPVSVTFDAILDKVYPGQVVEIGQVGQKSQSVVNFTVSVQLQDADAQVKPGMTAVANIRVAALTDVLQLPNRAIQESDGKRYVYLMAPEGPKQVYIQLGATSDTASEVLSSELKEGDEIALEAPLFSGGEPAGVRQNQNFQGGGQP